MVVALEVQVLPVVVVVVVHAVTVVAHKDGNGRGRGAAMVMSWLRTARRHVLAVAGALYYRRKSHRDSVLCCHGRPGEQVAQGSTYPLHDTPSVSYMCVPAHICAHLCHALMNGRPPSSGSMR